jgi:hypothetical protein
MLVTANCTPPTILLKVGNPTTTQTLYIYKTAYVAPSGSSSWTSVEGQIQQFQRERRDLVEEKRKPQQLSWGFVCAILR